MVEQIRKKARGRPPISRHPLFPATVALWFAALFGLGSLIIRPAVLESLVLAVHLDAIIPAAAPPLGATARMLLALAMAALGGIVGLVAGYRIPRSSYGAGAGRFAEREEAEENPLWSDLKTRHRAIAVEQEEVPPEAELPAPAIDVAPQILDLATMEADSRDEIDAPLPIEAVAAAEEIEEIEAAPVETAAEPTEDRHVPDMATPEPAEPLPAPVRSGKVWTPLAARASDVRNALPASTAAERIASAELSELSHVELLERLALSLERRRQAPVAAVAALPAEVAPEPEPEIAPWSEIASLREVPPIAAPIAAVPPPVEEPVAAELPEPAPAELPRFMSALVAPALSADKDTFEDDEDDAAFMPRFLPSPSATAGRQDLAPDETPWGRPAEPAHDHFAEPEVLGDAEADGDIGEDDFEDDLEDGEPVLEESYSSLLSLGRAAPQRPFIRIDEAEPAAGVIEPAVIFPGQVEQSAGRFDAPSVAAALGGSAQPSRRPFDAPGTAATAPTPPFATLKPQGPEETEAALRAALAALQRMSGAA